VLEMPELTALEHLRDRGFWVQPQGATDGPHYPGAPFKMSATPWRLKRPAPSPGEHSPDILSETGGAA
jgi:benzylsuccinate CoA-transferase BbsE subunit